VFYVQFFFKNTIFDIFIIKFRKMNITIILFASCFLSCLLICDSNVLGTMARAIFSAGRNLAKAAKPAKNVVHLTDDTASGARAFKTALNARKKGAVNSFDPPNLPGDTFLN
jgi:hypothetical protein